MVSTFSPLLRIELIGTGDQSGVWGVTTNRNLGTLLEAAIAGGLDYTHPDTDNPVLTASSGLADEARNMIIDISGTLTADRNLICPTSSKVYIVRNGTAGGFAVTFKTVAGTGVALANGEIRILFCDGTNVADAGLAYQQQINSLLLNSIARDGSVVPTANLPMATFRHTGVGNAVARDDYAAAGQIQDQGVVFVPASGVGGTANAITLTPTPAITAYAAGQKFVFVVELANTGPVTVDVSAVGPVALESLGSVALASGQLAVGDVLEITNTGSEFEITGVAGNTTAFTRTLLDDLNAAAARTTLDVPGLSVANTFTEDVTIDVSSGVADFRVRSPNNSGSPVEWHMAAHNDIGQNVDYINFTLNIVDNTDGSEDGELSINSIQGGSILRVCDFRQGLVMRDAVGGDQGQGTINTPQIFQNAVEVHPLAAGLQTPQSAASGTTKDYTNVRADAHRITVYLMNVSTNGTGEFLVQIGSGAVDTSGYTSTADLGGTELTSTAGFILNIGGVAASTWSGKVVLDLADASNNTWISTGRVQRDGIFVAGEHSSGIKSLSGALDRVRITTVGPDTFDGGSVNIRIE